MKDILVMISTKEGDNMCLAHQFQMSNGKYYVIRNGVTELIIPVLDVIELVIREFLFQNESDQVVELDHCGGGE